MKCRVRFHPLVEHDLEATTEWIIDYAGINVAARKLSEIEELPKAENQADKETAHRIQTLREHLREIHEQEKQEERDLPLTARLAKLWKRVEY